MSITAEVDEIAAKKRHEQGWVDEIESDLKSLLKKVTASVSKGEVLISLYLS